MPFLLKPDYPQVKSRRFFWENWVMFLVVKHFIWQIGCISYPFLDPHTFKIQLHILYVLFTDSVVKNIGMLTKMRTGP